MSQTVNHPREDHQQIDTVKAAGMSNLLD